MHGCVSAGNQGSEGLCVCGASGWRDQSVRMVWVCMSVRDRQPARSWDAQRVGAVAREPGIAVVINLG